MTFFKWIIETILLIILLKAESEVIIVTRRGNIRKWSFIIAIILVLGIMDIKYLYEKNEAEERLGYVYSKSIEDLANSVDNIKNELNKGLYTADTGMLSKLASQLWSHASAAKSNLSGLPISELNLENTYKFLSQVGNYALSLSRKCADEVDISEEEYANLQSLYQYSQSLSDKMWALEQEMQMGMVDFNGEETENTDNVSADLGFQEFEDSFEEYPTLIYDGPYSDHILNKEPIMIRNQPEISKDEALKKAQYITKSDKLTDNGDEGGKMPSYTFTDGYNTVSITKNGGYPSYIIRDRSVDSAKISLSDAQNIAKEFVSTLGFDEVKMTYYETVYNTLTINFAGVQNCVTLYTDLIKVSVALDNGEILGLDARGYITNHTKRTFNESLVSIEEAQKKLSPLLEVKGVSEALVPTEGQNEALCYEYSCVNESGQNILVYVNGQTGKEEQILLLMISENGVLTV